MGEQYKKGTSHSEANWYFEPVGENCYKIYTYKTGDNDRQYIYSNDRTKMKISNVDQPVGIQLSKTNADIFELGTIDTSTSPYDFSSAPFAVGGTFGIRNVREILTTNTTTYLTRYLQYSGSGGGLRYHTDFKNGSAIFDLPSANTTDSVYTASSYDSISISDTAISVSGNASNSTLPDYQTLYDTYCGENNTYQLIYVTETVKQNKLLDSVRSAPYVTSNPKRIVPADNKFLTGDGIYNSSSTPDYAGSMVSRIVSDLNSEDQPKRYNSTGLTTEKIQNLTEKLDTYKKYTTYVTARGSSSLPANLKNMPVLILDDADAVKTTAMINNYLKLLTNTSNFTFSETSDAYTVNIAKCTYTNGVLSCDYSGTANLVNDTQNYQFKLTGTAYDNGGSTEQFTLIDVAFKDPSDPTKAAYHLYVPAFVKKMLYFDFNVGTISGTTYRTQPYEEVYGNSIVENTGNPITIQFRWTYNRDLEEWTKYISSGERLLWSYKKVLDVTDRTEKGLPANTRMVLVDANNNNHVYYGDNITPTAGLFSYDNNKITAINLDGFKNGNTDFAPIQFNDFFDITTVLPSNWTQDGDAGYYRTSAKFVVDNANGTVKANDGNKYKISDGENAVYLYVKFKDGMTYETADHKLFLKEDYYITFFTPVKENDELRHLVIGMAASFPDPENTSNPSSRSGYNPTHL